MPDVGLIPNNTAALSGQLVAQPQQGMQQQIGTMQSLMQMQGAAMELRARAAMGPLAQASIDPATGSMDYNKFATMIAADPRTAWKAPEVINQLVQREQTQALTLKTKFETAIEAQKLVGNELAGLLQEGDLVTRDHLAKAVANLRGTEAGQSLFPTDAAALQFIMSKPKGGPQLAAFIRQAVLRGGAAQNSLESTYKTVFGTPGTVETGGTVTPTLSKPGEMPRFGSPVAKDPTTEEINKPTAVVGEDGSESVKPASEVYPLRNAAGRPVTSPGGPAAAPPPGAPGAPDGGGSGALPPSNTTKLSPAALDLQKSRWGGAEKYEKELDQQTAAATNVLALAKQAQGALDQVKPGGGGNVRAEVGSMLQAMKSAGVPGVTDDRINKVANGSLAGSQEFKKLMMQLATQLMTESLRGGGRFTNLEYSNFQQSNPNLDTDPKAVKEMLGFIVKMANLRTEEQQLYSEYKQRALESGDKRSSIQDFKSGWQRYLVKRGILAENK